MNHPTAPHVRPTDDGGRLPDGRAFPGTNVVIADAIAALARTNLRAVTRVLLAIDILRKHLEVPVLSLDAMLDPADAPQDKVRATSNSVGFDAMSSAKQARISAIFNLVEAVDANPAVADLLLTMDLT
jgi:hypothetical protein